MVHLRHLRYLLAVAEHESFTRAAETLHVSQPTLSQQIKQLETALGTKLLDRSGRTVRPTDAGEVLLQHARRALRELDAGERAIHDVADLSRGSLRLALTPTFHPYLVGPLVGRFNALYPAIDLVVKEMAQERIEDDIAEDRLDIGIAFTPSQLAGIDVQELHAESLEVVVGTRHPAAASEDRLDPQQLARLDLVLLTEDFATRQHIENYFRAHEISPRIAVQTNSVSTVLELVRAGQLATVLPDRIAFQQTDLSAVAIDPPLPPRTAALLRRAGAHHSAATTAFTTLMASSRGQGDLR